MNWTWKRDLTPEHLGQAATEEDAKAYNAIQRYELEARFGATHHPNLDHRIAEFIAANWLAWLDRATKGGKP